MRRHALIGRVKEWFRSLTPEGRKKIFLSKRTMVLIDHTSGLMECQVCGSRHFALMPPVGGDEYVGIPGFRRGSWQCVNGCRIDPERRKRARNPSGTHPGERSRIHEVDPEALLDHPQEHAAQTLDPSREHSRS